MVARARAAVLDGTVGLAQAADTNGLAHVDVAGDSGGADVEPIDALRWELTVVASLDGVDPTPVGNVNTFSPSLSQRIQEGLKTYGMGSLPCNKVSKSTDEKGICSNAPGASRRKHSC